MTNDEIIFEDEDTAGDPAGQLKKLRDKLKKAEADKGEYLAGWQRSKADYINLEKSSAKARAEAIAFAKERVLSDIISVADSFDMAFANKEAWEKAPSDWRIGVEYIYNQLVGILSEHGLSKIDLVGQDFDPNIAEAIGTEPTDDPAQDHQIASVLKPGYQMGDRVIRPAQVKIYKLQE